MVPLSINNDDGLENGITESSQLLNSNKSSSINNDLATSTIKNDTEKIGYWGSISIAVNSLTGPAMLSLPATFQRCGLIPTIITIIFVCLLSSACSLHMADTISKIPGNENFQREVEFSDTFKYFWGGKWYIFTQAVFFICVTCLNISSIVDTSQVVDTILGHWIVGGSAAMKFSVTNGFEWIRWDPNVCTEEELMSGECIAFANNNFSDDDDGSGSSGVLLTIGYIATAFIFFPMSLMDLKENAYFQIMGFVVLLLTTMQFAIQLVWTGVSMDNVTLWGQSWNTLFGVVLFNFALVIALPAWLYERHSSVDVSSVVYESSILSSFLYIIMGSIGALSISNVSDNMLENMISGIFGKSLQLGGSVFAFMIIGLGIPLFSVLTRLNLTSNGQCSNMVGNLLAVIFPWSISWILYQGSGITNLLSWGGTLFTSLVAFLLPLSLALHTVMNNTDKIGSIFGRKKEESKRSKILTLILLLLLAVLSIAVAFIGLFLDEK